MKKLFFTIALLIGLVAYSQNPYPEKLRVPVYTQTQVNDTLSNYPLYDEGTFTGTFAGSISGTFNSGACRYVRIGNQVTVWVSKSVSTSGLDGELRFINLPYNVVEPVYTTVTHDDGNITLGSSLRVQATATGDEVGFFFYPNDTAVEITDLQSNIIMIFQLTYITDDP